MVGGNLHAMIMKKPGLPKREQIGPITLMTNGCHGTNDEPEVRKGKEEETAY